MNVTYGHIVLYLKKITISPLSCFIVGVSVLLLVSVMHLIIYNFMHLHYSIQLNKDCYDHKKHTKTSFILKIS